MQNNEIACEDPEEGRGSEPLSPENNKNIAFLSNTGRDPLKNYKATKPDSNQGRHRHASKTQL